MDDTTDGDEIGYYDRHTAKRVDGVQGYGRAEIDERKQ